MTEAVQHAEGAEAGAPRRGRRGITGQVRRWWAGRSTTGRRRERERGRVEAARRARAATLVAEAERRAYADVADGVFDQWSFDGERLLSHLSTLRANCEREIAEARRSIADRIRAQRAEQARSQAEYDVLHRRLGFLEQLHEEAQQFGRRAATRMDRVATREAERRRIFGLLPRGGRRNGSRPPAAEVADLDRQAEAEAMQQLGISAITATQPWEGLAAPPVGALARWLTLLGLVLVELPITFFVFYFFHGSDPTAQVMTWLFAAPTAFVLVVLPHFAGRLLRHRHATGREVLSVVLSLALISPWAYVAYQLGTLRGKVLMVPTSTPPVIDDPLGDGAEQEVPLLSDQLGVEPATITHLFVALMLLTGGIGFLLGLAHEHPFQAAFRAAGDQRRKLERQLSRIRPLVAPLGEPSEQDRSAEEADTVGSIRAAYVAAEHAYLDAISRAMGDPAVTEVIAKLSDTLANRRENHRG
ncbi:hypothetical protein ACPXB5_20745 [Micromonospora arida]|uniref:hypothetical protein n=1 Tax=Micromonospora arida TaxID=2203715 RepID=UPI003CF82811